MNEEELPPLNIFSPILILEYVRLMTAAFYIRSENKSEPIRFRIKPEYYQQLKDCPVQAPLIGLSLEYDAEQEILSVRAGEKFIQSYENKIQNEVALNFEKTNQQRYSQYIEIIA